MCVHREKPAVMGSASARTAPRCATAPASTRNPTMRIADPAAMPVPAARLALEANVRRSAAAMATAATTNIASARSVTRRRSSILDDAAVFAHLARNAATRVALVHRSAARDSVTIRVRQGNRVIPPPASVDARQESSVVIPAVPTARSAATISASTPARRDSSVTPGPVAASAPLARRADRTAVRATTYAARTHYPGWPVAIPTRTARGANSPAATSAAINTNTAAARPTTRSTAWRHPATVADAPANSRPVSSHLESGRSRSERAITQRRFPPPVVGLFRDL